MKHILLSLLTLLMSSVVLAQDIQFLKSLQETTKEEATEMVKDMMANTSYKFKELHEGEDFIRFRYDAADEKQILTVFTLRKNKKYRFSVISGNVNDMILIWNRYVNPEHVLKTFGKDDRYKNKPEGLDFWFYGTGEISNSSYPPKPSQP